MNVRSYDPDRDAEALWALKREFELGLGTETGPDDKEAKYEAKLTDEYRERYLDWVERCMADDDRCVTVAESDGDEGALVGYAFVLPDSLSMIWDAAVLNELYVREEHRGTGVADDLMETAISIVREQDLPLDRFVFDVDRENDRALAFYERYGFEHWGEMLAKEI